MKLNLRNIELNDNYEGAVGSTVLEMMSGTDMYSYIKYVTNPNLDQLTDLRAINRCGCLWSAIPKGISSMYRSTTQ